MEAGPSTVRTPPISPIGVQYQTPLDNLIQEYTWIIGVKERLDKIAPGGVVTVYNRSGQLEIIDRTNFERRLNQVVTQLRSLPANQQPTPAENAECSSISKIKGFKKLIIINSDMRDFIRQVFLGKHRSMFTPNDLNIIQILMVDRGIASQTLLNILLSLYNQWEDLYTLGTSNIGLPPIQIRRIFYGSTPELKTLFNAVMPKLQALQNAAMANLPPNPTRRDLERATKVFNVDNYKITDLSKVIGISRDKIAEANFQPKLHNRDEIVQYSRALNELCQLEVAKQKAIGGKMPYDPMNTGSELPYLQAAAGLSITTQYRAAIDRLDGNLKRQLQFIKILIRMGVEGPIGRPASEMLGELQVLEVDYKVICANPEHVTKGFLRFAATRTGLDITLPADLSRISKKEICQIIDQQVKVKLDVLKQRAGMAAELAPGVILQPGGQIVRGYLPTPYGFSSEVGAGPVYLPGELPEFGELFDTCQEPEKVNKNLLLRLAGSIIN